MNETERERWVRHPPVEPADRVVHLLRRIAFAYAARVSEAAAELDLNPNDLRALALILDATRADEVLTLGGLGSKLRMNQPTVTAVVDRLERRSLVERRPVPGDRRKVGLAVTRSGRDAGWAAFGAMIEGLRAHLSAEGATQLAHAEEVLQRALAVLDR